MKELHLLLTTGLTNGYGGKGEKPKKVERGSFIVKSSQLDIDGGMYLDQWIAGNHVGGGQEIVQKGEEKATRLYAGGTVSNEVLEKIGITEDDVIGYLKKKVVELGNQTRLYEDCDPTPDGKWKYTYKIKHTIPEISFSYGAETIHYDGTFVFGHGHMNSPVK